MMGRSTIRSFLGLSAAALAGAGLAGCIDDAPVGVSSQPVINGEVVAKSELPTIGGIATNAGSVCTGTLITDTVVLTAAHCIEPELIKQSIQASGGTPPETIEYYFTFERDMDPQNTDAPGLIPVERVEWHEEFLSDFDGLLDRPGRWHDIGLMFLAEPVSDRPFQRLATSDVVDTLELERTHLVAGYGQTDDSDPMSAGTLTRGLSKLNERGDNELIAGIDDDQQACRGDSGGPIFADDEDTFQIGIASRINADIFGGGGSGGPPPCETGLLYTRVDTYRSWIQERVPELGDGENGNGDGDGEGDGDGNGDGNSAGGGDGGGCQAGGGASGLGALLLLAACLLSLRRRCRAC